MIFKPLLGNKKYFLLGSGERPKGAKNCGLFVEGDTKRPNSYGMPSGHSQGSAFFLTYLLMHLRDTNININKKIIGGSLFTFITLGVMYSRIYLKCHTIQQVILGGLFGMGFGYLYYENKDKIKKHIKIYFEQPII